MITLIFAGNSRLESEAVFKEKPETVWKAEIAQESGGGTTHARPQWKAHGREGAGSHPTEHQHPDGVFKHPSYASWLPPAPILSPPDLTVVSLKRTANISTPSQPAAPAPNRLHAPGAARSANVHQMHL